MPTVVRVPRGPMVNHAPRRPTDVLTPDLDRFKRTPGATRKELRKRKPSGSLRRRRRALHLAQAPATVGGLAPTVDDDSPPGSAQRRQVLAPGDLCDARGDVATGLSLAPPASRRRAQRAHPPRRSGRYARSHVGSSAPQPARDSHAHAGRRGSAASSARLRLTYTSGALGSRLCGLRTLRLSLLRRFRQRP